MTTANLVINGSTSVVVRSGDEMVDLIQQGRPQHPPLGGVQEEIDATIKEPTPTPGRGDRPAAAAST